MSTQIKTIGILGAVAAIALSFTPSVTSFSGINNWVDQE